MRQPGSQSTRSRPGYAPGAGSLWRNKCTTATCEPLGLASMCQRDCTLDEAIPSGTDKVGALHRNAIPTPLKHLDDYRLVRGGGASLKRMGSERTVALNDWGESCSRSHEESKLRPRKHW